MSTVVLPSRIDMPRTALQIEKRPEVCGGEACLAGTRIPVWLLEHARRLGTSREQLLRSYPTLTAESLAEAWNYAQMHLQEINEAIDGNEAG